jgi:hypothetical protein
MFQTVFASQQQGAAKQSGETLPQAETGTAKVSPEGGFATRDVLD